MSLNEQPTYYDILDLKPEASPQEIREAYLRIKATYNKDSVALYSLVSPSEREEMLRLIEEAYDTLSNSDRRKEYDRFHGLIDSRDFLPPVRPPTKKIVSIDRVPPMDIGTSSDDLLVAPTTDFNNAGGSIHATTGTDPFGIPMSSPPPSPPPMPGSLTEGIDPATDPFQSQPPVAPPIPQPPRFAGGIHRPSQASEIASSLAREIEAETEWTGLFIKRVREVRNISIEELSSTTKISKTYLQAVEDENYPKLPAAVYVRGFVSQMARALKLPQDKVATAYMARFTKHATDK